ncbi:MAG: hypothetical protein GX892_02175 [Thermoanaerobacteraceae bacterium]|nr:hypothetical protein [Thermoanaerobacteraceae bacterium]
MTEFFIFVEEWLDAVDVYSNPETINNYNEAVKELEEGKSSEWVPGTFSS